MSSCNASPVIMEVIPTSACCCAIKTSCNGRDISSESRSMSALTSFSSRGCDGKRSCNAPGGPPPLRTLPLPVSRMLLPPCLNPLHMVFPAKVAWVLAAPVPPARPRARRLALRLHTKALVVRVAVIWLEPTPTLATSSQSRPAHRLLPEEYPGRI